MSIRSKKAAAEAPVSVAAEAPAATDAAVLAENETASTAAPPVEPTPEETQKKAEDQAKVQAAAKMASTKQAVYRLLTPYTIVAPNGVRFYPGEPTPAPATPWMDSNVKAKIFEVVKQ